MTDKRWRRALLGGVVAATGTMVLASAAFACTYDKGYSKVTDNNGHYIFATGDRTSMWWCNKNYGGYTNGTPVTNTTGTYPGTNSGDATWVAIPTISFANGTALTWSQNPEPSTDNPNCLSSGVHGTNQVSDSSTYMITYVLGDPRSSTTSHNCHNSATSPSTAFPSTVQSGGTPGTYNGVLTIANGAGTFNLPASDTKAIASTGYVSICLQDSSNKNGNGNFDANLSAVQGVL